MSKSAFARDLSERLGTRVSRQMVDKYHVRGMPVTTVDAAVEWLAMSSVGKPYKAAMEILKARSPQVATSSLSDATLQPADDSCGYNSSIPREPLTAEDADSFYVDNVDGGDVYRLSRILQEIVPKFAQLDPDAAEAVRYAIRGMICVWSGGQYCPHCRRAAGLPNPPEPPEPDDEPEADAPC